MSANDVIGLVVVTDENSPVEIFNVPLVLRDLDLYEEILFDHYLKADDNLDFAKVLNDLKNNPALYQTMQEHSKAISDFYSKENVLEMWKKFYLDAYNEKQDK